MARRMIALSLPAAMVLLAAGCAGPPVRTVQATNRDGAPPVTVTVTATSAPMTSGITLPMRVIESESGTLVYVPVRVNGHGPYDFVLDTGSSTSSVDRSLVNRLGLPRTGQAHRVQGVTGSGLVPVVKVRHWTLGGVPLHATTLSVVDLGMGVAGLLGSDELRRFGGVTLDFRNHRVILRRP